MSMEVIRSNTRGKANFGWLDSRHTFSFGRWHNPNRMGFGHLRVINEDRVLPGRGFGAHPHQNMEIISYPVQGALAHKDSTGGGGVIRHGEVQVMGAGTGVRHSEMNGSDTESVHFLQIWILPKTANTEPHYADKMFGLDQRGKVLVVSGDGREGSLRIGQDVDLYRLLLDANESVTHTPARSRQWVQVIGGELQVNGERLQAGDGMALVGRDALSITANADAEALLFDLE